MLETHYAGFLLNSLFKMQIVLVLWIRAKSESGKDSGVFSHLCQSLFRGLWTSPGFLFLCLLLMVEEATDEVVQLIVPKVVQSLRFLNIFTVQCWVLCQSHKCGIHGHITQSAPAPEQHTFSCNGTYVCWYLFVCVSVSVLFCCSTKHVLLH